MLLLKQQLLRKAKIINDYRHPIKQNKSVILQKLKKIKKQLKSTQKQTQKISQTVFAQRVTQSSYTQQLYFMTFTIMKAFDKQFQFLPQEKDIYKNFIQMNINFYLKQEAFSKAEEISRTSRKKLLQKNMIFPTLLSWLFQWTKRKFDFFLKQNIKSLERDLIVDHHLESITINTKNQKTQINSAYYSQLQLNSSLKLKRFEIFQKNNPQNLKYTNSIITLNKFQDRRHQFPKSQLSQYKTQLIQKNNPLQIASYKSAAQILEGNDKSMLPFKNYSRLSITNLQQEKVSQLYINKQAFYGCFYDQFKKYYKKMNCIQDIDHYYLKTFRRNNQSKKQMIEQRMADMIQALMKNQSEANNSIKKYYQTYSQKFPQFKKRQNKKKEQNRIEKQLKNSQLVKNYSFNRKYSLARAKFLKSQTSAQERTQSMIDQKICQNNKISQICCPQQQQSNLKKRIDSKDQKQKQIQCIRLPVVCNNLQDINKPFQFGIDSKKQKNRNLKGLIRYKFVNKIKQSYSQCEQAKFQLQKSQQFQLGNIRKILKQRLLRKKQQQNLFCNSSLNIQTDSSQKAQKANNAKIDFHVTKNARYTCSKPTDINLRQMCANISSIHQQMSSNYFQLKNNGKVHLLPQIQKGNN